MVAEPAVGLAVATAVAVSISLQLVRLLATGAEAALNVVQWPSLSQMTGGEGLWRRRSLASVGNTTSRVKATIVTTFMLFPRPRDDPQLLSRLSKFSAGSNNYPRKSLQSS